MIFNVISFVGRLVMGWYYYYYYNNDIYYNNNGLLNVVFGVLCFYVEVLIWVFVSVFIWFFM